MATTHVAHFSEGACLQLTRLARSRILFRMALEAVVDARVLLDSCHHNARLRAPDWQLLPTFTHGPRRRAGTRTTRAASCRGSMPGARTWASVAALRGAYSEIRVLHADGNLERPGSKPCFAVIILCRVVLCLSRRRCRKSSSTI
jgi:hypothetical protein